MLLPISQGLTGYQKSGAFKTPLIMHVDDNWCKLLDLKYLEHELAAGGLGSDLIALLGAE